jgi:outer membrane protein OmpA-like peptidoglycan-associated protein
VALQSDKVAWENALKDYDMLKFNNCISQKGYSDFFVKTYKITETPSSFLIDELGKIVIINPSVKNIIDYLEDQRNVQLNTDLQTVVSGKIILGNANSVPVSNQKLFLLNSKNDTVQTVSTNESGAFEFDNINASTSYKLLLQTNSSLINDNNLHLFLASPNNEIVSNFKFEDDIYAYDLLECELPYLKSVNDNHSKNKVDDGSIEDLYTLAVLFNSKTSVLSKDAIFKLNPIIAKLKANPKTKLHIISHTDSNGDEPSNLALTSKQSNSIITLLVSKGISKSRLLGVAKGETEIINKCQDSIPCSDSEHGLNRRTEFKFYPIQ